MVNGQFSGRDIDNDCVIGWVCDFVDTDPHCVLDFVYGRMSLHSAIGVRYDIAFCDSVIGVRYDIAFCVFILFEKGEMLDLCI